MKNMISRILYLLELNNIKPSKLCLDLKIANSSITDWKRGKGNPSVETIIKICDYFNVSMDWLVLGREETLAFPNEDLPFMSVYNKLNAIGKAEVRGYAIGLLKSDAYKTDNSK